MSEGKEFDVYNGGTSPSPSKRTVNLARKIALLAAIIISITLATRLITYWLDIPAAWPTIAASFFAIVAGSITLAGDGFKASPLSRGPVVAALVISVVLVLISALTLFLGKPVVAGSARASSSAASANGSDSPPFVIGVDAYASRGCGTYSFKETERELEPIPGHGDTSVDLDQWLREHEAIQSEPYGKYTVAHLIVNLTGQTESPVTITGISFEAVKRQVSGVSGTVVSGQCGDATSGRFIEADLDTDPPSVVSTNTDPNGIWGSDPQELTPVKYPYTVKNGDSEPFYIVAHTNAYVEYQIRVGWIYQSRVGSTIIDNHGSPFKVSVLGPNAPPARNWTR
ncbi:hypothetical protein ACTXG7_19525 [Mycolicibacterium sp. Dal123E01]|uniref:hypothetical protein n=1 Tax=Mycolicibacterium sp. Dal123E01 TaxID=3457578 RepID=UPI00403EC0A3